MSLDLLRKKLKEIFGHDDFKSETQMRATLAVYEKQKNVYICMPTGSGKSLCFQLPAILQKNKVALVFSPLIALIKNQIDILESLKIRAKSLNSKTPMAERTAITKDLQSKTPKIKMLYITPEMAATRVFENLVIELYNSRVLSYIVIDEAHCLSEWGHDFRPAYRQLGRFRELCRDIPLIALTATADKEVVSDIFSTLKMQSPTRFSLPVYRSNLYYDVWFAEALSNPFIHLKNFIAEAVGPVDESVPKNKRNCGIIYCRKKDTTTLLAEKLSGLGIKTLAYHAGLSLQHRTLIQNKWTSGEVSVIAATCSFGMGVDKGPVRFVVHWTVPQSVASYYQESGRAGRDGKPAFCRIYFSNEEHNALSYILRSTLDQSSNQAALIWKNFQKMVSYCSEAKCRHAVFSKFFGDSPLTCKMQCDSCKNKKKVENRIDEFKSCGTNVRGQRPTSSSIMDGIALPKYDTQADNDYDSDDTSSDRIKAQEKREAKELIAQQFALRRGKAKSETTKPNKQSALALSKSNVQSADVTHIKVRGLTTELREHFYGLLTKELMTNYKMFKNHSALASLTEKDINKLAKELEYSVFSRTTAVNVYKYNISKVVHSLTASNNSGVLDANLEQYESNASTVSCYQVSKKSKTESKEGSNVGNDFVLAKEIYKNFKPPDDKKKSKDTNKKVAKISDYLLKSAKLNDTKAARSQTSPECEFRTALQITRNVERNEGGSKRKINAILAAESACANFKRKKGESDETAVCAHEVDEVSTGINVPELDGSKISIKVEYNSSEFLNNEVSSTVRHTIAEPLGTLKLISAIDSSENENHAAASKNINACKLSENVEFTGEDISTSDAVGAPNTSTHRDKVSSNIVCIRSSSKIGSTASHRNSLTKHRAKHCMNNSKEVVALIKSELNPYYKTKYIPDKESFVKIARSIHKDLQKYHTYDKQDINALVSKYINKNGLT